MIRRLAVAALLIAAVLFSLYGLPLACWIVLSNLFQLVAAREFARLTASDDLPATVLMLPPVLLLPWVWTFRPDLLVPFLILSWLWIALAGLLLSREMAQMASSVTAAAAGFVYVGGPFALSAGYHPDSLDAPRSLLVLLLMVWTSDAAAYFVGRNFGTRRVTPRLSPRKTLEGYLAAVLAPAVVGLAVAAAAGGGSGLTVTTAAIGGVVGVAALTGDLFQSALKRGAGVKDSSELLPGHGGVLDRIDSFLIAMPVYWLVTGGV